MHKTLHYLLNNSNPTSNGRPTPLRQTCEAVRPSYCAQYIGYWHDNVVCLSVCL